MSGFPSSWREVEIGSIADVIGGGTPKAGDATNFAEPGSGVAWLTPADLSGYDKKGISFGKRDLSSKGLETSSAKLMPKGTVLFSSRAPIGYVAIAQTEISTNQGFKSFIFTNHIDSSYAYYYLKSIRPLAESRGTGTTFKELSGAAAKKLPFVVAPLNEQIRIANKLDSLLAKVDAAQTRLEKIPTLLKRFRQAVLAAATSGELTREWREVKIFDATLTSLGNAGVEVKTGPFGSALHKSDYISDGIPVINPMHIKDGNIFPASAMTISKEKFNDLLIWKLQKGDVIIGRRGEMGRAAEVMSSEPIMLCGTGSMIIRGNKEKILPSYLSLVLRSPTSISFFENNSVGSTMVNLNQKIIKALEFHYPSIEEQKQIVRRVESLFTLADTVEKQYLATKQRLDRLSQSILAKAFRGELVPQDPNDEPASELLERIRAIKTETVKVGKRKKSISSKRDVMSKRKKNA